VKIRKPEDEKYFKDITLNSILQEISKENEVSQHRSAPKKTEKRSKTLLIFKMIFFGIFPILLLLFFFIPFKQTDTKIAKKTETYTTAPSDKKSVSKTETKDKVIKKIAIAKKPKTPKESNVVEIVSKKEAPKNKTAREKAKENLLKQMKN
jgi:cytoskeletal protein RodZ